MARFPGGEMTGNPANHEALSRVRLFVSAENCAQGHDIVGY